MYCKYHRYNRFLSIIIASRWWHNRFLSIIIATRWHIRFLSIIIATRWWHNWFLSIIIATRWHIIDSYLPLSLRDGIRDEIRNEINIYIYAEHNYYDICMESAMKTKLITIRHNYNHKYHLSFIASV
jgi:hypothetical protein